MKRPPMKVENWAVSGRFGCIMVPRDGGASPPEKPLGWLWGTVKRHPLGLPDLQENFISPIVSLDIARGKIVCEDGVYSLGDPNRDFFKWQCMGQGPLWGDLRKGGFFARPIILSLKVLTRRRD